MNESIAGNLASTVAGAAALELPAELLEFSIDQVIGDELFKDIPGVSWIAKGLSAAQSISDRIFYNKILRFLFALEKSDPLARDDCRQMMRVDEDYRKRVGEHLVLILDKLDSLQKAEILSKCFSRFIDGDMDHDHFMDLAHVVDRASLSDLKAISIPEWRKIVFRDDGIAASSGILEYGLTERGGEERKLALGTRLSKYGTDLRDILLGEFKDRVAADRERRKELEELFG